MLCSCSTSNLLPEIIWLFSDILLIYRRHRHRASFLSSPSLAALPSASRRSLALLSPTPSFWALPPPSLLSLHFHSSPSHLSLMLLCPPPPFCSPPCSSPPKQSQKSAENRDPPPHALSVIVLILVDMKSLSVSLLSAQIWPFISIFNYHKD